MFKLQNLRHARHVKWPIYIMFGFIIISFVFFYGWNQANKSGGPGEGQSFARLRSESMSPLHRWTELDRTSLQAARPEAENEIYALMPQQMQQMLMQQRVVERLVTTEDIARTAANNVLIERAADKMGVRVTQDDIIRMLKAQPNISDQMLDQQAKMMGLPDKFAFVDFIRRSQEQQRVKDVKGLVAHASLFELWQEYSLANEKLALRLAAYPAEKFESKVNVTPADLEKYLADHKDAFHVQPMRRYAYIAVNRNDLAGKIKPTKEQLQVFYEKNQAQYVEKPATRVFKLTSPLGQDQVSTAPLKAFNAMRDQFAKAKEDQLSTLTQTLRKQYPQVEVLESTAWLEEGDQSASPTLLERVKSMDQGTTVVTDNNGVHLVRVLQKRKEGAPALDKIQNRVESDYKEKMAGEEFQKEAERIKAERAKLEQDKNTSVTLRNLAQRLKMKDELTTRVEATSAEIPGVGDFTKDRNYLASLAENELSEALQTDDAVAVVQIVEQRAGYDPKLAEVKDKVEKAYRKSRSSELAKAAAEQSLNLVKSGADFNKATAEAPKPAVDTPEFTRMEPVESLGAPLIDFKQQTLQANVGSTGLSAYGQDKDNPEGYAVWKVTKLAPPKQEDFTKERQRFEADYLQVQRETLVREWLADQRRQAQYHYFTAEERK